MWCSTCQQDVSSPVSPEGGHTRCGKCGQLLTDNRARPAKVEKTAIDQRVCASMLAEDDWALEAELRGVQRMLASLKSSAPIRAESAAAHAPHTAPSGWHATRAADGLPPRESIAGPRQEAVAGQAVAELPKGNLAAWTILSLGLATFACGAVLLIWSLIARPDDLWPVGMPLALIGQAGLIFGLILQLDGLWHSSRKAAHTLCHLDDELARVRQATALLSTSRTSPAQSFYVHLAEGAPPQLLLADLKGQLDLLAQHLPKQR